MPLGLRIHKMANSGAETLGISLRELPHNLHLLEFDLKALLCALNSPKLLVDGNDHAEDYRKLIACSYLNSQFFIILVHLFL